MKSAFRPTETTKLNIVIWGGLKTQPCSRGWICKKTNRFKLLDLLPTGFKLLDLLATYFLNLVWLWLVMACSLVMVCSSNSCRLKFIASTLQKKIKKDLQKTFVYFKNQIKNSDLKDVKTSLLAVETQKLTSWNAGAWRTTERYSGCKQVLNINRKLDRKHSLSNCRSFNEHEVKSLQLRNFGWTWHAHRLSEGYYVLGQFQSPIIIVEVRN